MGQTKATDFKANGRAATPILYVPIATSMWDGPGEPSLGDMTRTWILFFQQLVGALQSNAGGLSEALAGTLVPINEVPAGVIDGANRKFTLTYAPIAGWLVLHLDNALEDPIADYALAKNVITYTIAPQPGDNHHAWYFQGAKALMGGNGSPPPLTIPPQTGFARHFGSAANDSLIWSPGSLYTGLSGDMSFGAWINIDSTAVPASPLSAFVRYGQALGGLPLDTLFWLALSGTAPGPWNIYYAHNDGTGFAGTGLQSNTFICGIPSGQWVYLGFSRSSAAKTVEMFLGNGAVVLSVATWTYGNPPLASGTGGLILGNADLGSGGVGASIEEHYIWSRDLSLAEHTDAMMGSPSTSGLVLASLMGNSTPSDISGTGGAATVTGTTVVPGHP